MKTPSASMASVVAALKDAVANPSLTTSRALEECLKGASAKRKVFGRVNQKASLEANSESDRGVAERLANAFDASLTAARLAMGISKSSRDLSPRKAAQRFFCPNPAKCDWDPQDKRISIRPPVLEFWLEAGDAKVRHRRYQTDEGLCTVLVADSGVGIPRSKMASTILDLNSDSKLETFEAIGQYGHGGSSSLAFCESALVLSQPRFDGGSSAVAWTLIYPERTLGDSKQDLVRYWFCDEEGLPFALSPADLPGLRAILPGTAVWHFGYSRGGWIKAIAGPEQTNPWGRLGRLFFSYPLPFEVRGQLARTDSPSGHRTLRGAFFRLVDEGQEIEYASGEKTSVLTVGGNRFGEFSAFFFVLREGGRVRNYIDPSHPIIGTLNGQNHGEMTKTIIKNAGLAELASSMIIELRLDGLDSEALMNIVANSRETLKDTAFRRALEDRLEEMLREDEELQELELRRQEAKARDASSDMSKRLSEFLSSILSDALGRPSPSGGGGEAPGKRKKHRRTLPEIPSADPPSILEFAFETPLVVQEGVTKLAKFHSDARPPKYSFNGDNPRLFAELRTEGEFRTRVSIAGHGDISSKGYGYVGVTCSADPSSPINARCPAGTLHLTLQSASGRTLHASLPIEVDVKPAETGRRRDLAVKVEIRFSCPDIAQADEFKSMLAEESISEMSSDLRDRAEKLEIEPARATYFSDSASRYGESILRVEINAASPGLKSLMEGCKTAEERIRAKDRYCRDIVLDCYQHEFALETLPETVHVFSDSASDEIRASEEFLNHDKAIRFAVRERDRERTTGS